jgi:hypothetical protein
MVSNSGVALSIVSSVYDAVTEPGPDWTAECCPTEYCKPQQSAHFDAADGIAICTLNSGVYQV